MSKYNPGDTFEIIIKEAFYQSYTVEGLNYAIPECWLDTLRRLNNDKEATEGEKNEK